MRLLSLKILASDEPLQFRPWERGGEIWKKRANKSLKYDKWQIFAWLTAYAKILVDFSVIPSPSYS